MERRLLRLLDIDDLIILSLLIDGKSKGEVSRYLKVTPPAISHRVRKYSDFSEGFVKEGLLTERGKKFAKRAKEALTILEKSQQEN